MRVVIITTSRMTKTINNTDYTGRCITGLNLDTDRVVRFVSNKQGAPIEYPCFLDYHKLDLVEVEVKQPCPHSCQAENLLVNYEHPKRYGKSELNIHNLYKRYQRGNIHAKCFMEDKFSRLSDISLYDHSLEMVRVTDLIISGKKCSFYYLSYHHRFYNVTDPDYKLNETDSKTIGDAYLVISIPTDPWNDGYYYKFVAAIYPIEPEESNISDNQARLSQSVKRTNISKEDCILKNGPSCRENCNGCTSYRPVAKI